MPAALLLVDLETIHEKKMLHFRIFSIILQLNLATLHGNK